MKRARIVGESIAWVLAAASPAAAAVVVAPRAAPAAITAGLPADVLVTSRVHLAPGEPPPASTRVERVDAEGRARDWGDGFEAALADLNGDGLLDVALATTVFPSFDLVVRVHRGLGGGLFAPPTSFVVVPGGAAFHELVVADVTADAVPDVLVATSTEGGRVDVWQGDGTGGFAPTALAFASAGAPVAVAVGDLDRDGALDVVIANGTTAGTLGLHLSDGAGGFALPALLAASPAEGRPVSVADLDGDGVLDLAVTHSTGNTVAVLFGDGTGALPTRAEFALHADPAVRGGPLAAGDLTGDGVPDLVTADRSVAAGRGGVRVLVGDGAGGFAPALRSPYGCSTSPLRRRPATSMGTGLLDVVAPGEGITILLNQPAF
jgi:hypothetical protein